MRRAILAKLAKLAALTALAALGLTGCADAQAVTPEQVISLSVCPADAGRCEPFADGRSQVTVAVGVPEDVGTRAADLRATVQLSEGRWAIPTDPTRPTELTVPLTAQGFATPSFITATTVGPLRIDALLAGYTSTAFVLLRPAPLDPDTLEVTPSAKVAPNTDITLEVKIRAMGNGAPSVGTKVAFAMAVEPPTATVTPFPGETVLEGGAALTKLYVTGAPTSVTATVTVTPPEDPTGQEVTSVSQPVSLPIAPLP